MGGEGLILWRLWIARQTDKTGLGKRDLKRRVLGSLRIEG